jgi:DNA-binding MarR family transcriptional regulator
MSLIALSADEADRRVKRLALTEGGRKLEAELTGTQMRLLEGVFERAGASAAEGWASVMEALSARPEVADPGSASPRRRPPKP